MKRVVSHILIGIAGWLIFEGAYSLYHGQELIKIAILFALGIAFYFRGDAIDGPLVEHQVGQIPSKG